MSTFKKIMIWIIIMGIVFIGGDVLIHHLLETSYLNIEYKAEENNLIDIGIDESRATNVDGFAKLTITNKSKEFIDKTYVVLEGFSKENNSLVKEYVEITDLEPNQFQKVQINYQAEKVKKIIVYQADNIEESNEKLFDFSNGFIIDKETFWLAFLAYLCIF